MELLFQKNSLQKTIPLHRILALIYTLEKLKVFVNMTIETIPGHKALARQEQIYHFYESWEKILDEKEGKIYSLRAETTVDKVFHALEVKKLIYRTKWDLFENWFQKKPPDHPQMILNPNSKLGEVLEKCYQIVHLQKNKTRIAEQKLLSQVDRVSQCITAGLNPILDSWYVQRAASLVDDQNRFMETTPVGRALGLDIPLWDSSLILSKGMTAAGLLGIDLAEWKLAGLSQNIPYAVANQMMPGGEFWLKSFEQLGIGDEFVVAKCLPWIRSSIQFSLFVGLGSYMSSQSYLEMSAIYFLAITVSTCAFYCVALFYRVFYREQNCPSKPFFQNLLTWVAFPLTINYVIPSVFHLWNTQSLTRELLLSDQNVCQAYPQHCRKEACATLGIDIQASSEEIRTAYKKLVIETHPDLSQGAEFPTIRDVNRAKEICLLPFKT